MMIKVVWMTDTATRESIEWLFGSLPGLSDHLSVDEYLRERNEKQEALFRKVDPMKGALELVKHLVGDV
jgi:pseudouridine-5'-monophosphatase